MSNVLVKKSVSVAFITVGGSIIVASIYALKPPQQYYFSGLGAFFLIIVPLFIGIWNYKQRHKPDPYVGGFPPTAGYTALVQQTPQTLKNIISGLSGSKWLGFFLGYQFFAAFDIQNTHDITLDRLSAEVTLTDSDTNKIRTQTFQIPDLLHGETNPNF